MPTILKVKVSPKAKQSKVLGWHGDAIKIAISAPPADGAANNELLRFLSNTLGLPLKSIHLLHGHSSKMKMLEIDSTQEELLRMIIDSTGHGKQQTFF